MGMFPKRHMTGEGYIPPTFTITFIAAYNELIIGHGLYFSCVVLRLRVFLL